MKYEKATAQYVLTLDLGLGPAGRYCFGL
ncbi:hypothetical protein F383_39213 [Gossypium arboreum]|uniref:Uncharacterized protein n=1 Tax=Gossypium arboreum TaxID=29729 RepID=A0A0B0MLF0_GOSAR|nr:hypothetical protein F383_39213 [Gossypium arboreum]